MEIVVELRPEIADILHGTVGRDEAAVEFRKIEHDLDEELNRLGVSLRPMHAVADPRLKRFFTISDGAEYGDAPVLESLRRLEAVTAAYAKPPAEPA